MSASSYERSAQLAMPDTCDSLDWVELPSHKAVRDAVEDWLVSERQSGPFRVSGAAGVGKSSWLQDFTRRKRSERYRWIRADFAHGESVTPQRLLDRWSVQLTRWVERPTRYAQGDSARRWVDLATKTIEAQGIKVIRVIESDRFRFEGTELPSIFAGSLWLAREPFRGSNFTPESAVLPIWSHDDLASVLSRRWPGLRWPDSTIGSIWSQSSGRARQALSLARILANETESRNESAVVIDNSSLQSGIRSRPAKGIGLFETTDFLFNSEDGSRIVDE